MHVSLCVALLFDKVRASPPSSPRGSLPPTTGAIKRSTVTLWGTGTDTSSDQTDDDLNARFKDAWINDIRVSSDERKNRFADVGIAQFERSSDAIDVNLNWPLGNLTAKFMESINDESGVDSGGEPMQAIVRMLARPVTTWSDLLLEADALIASMTAVVEKNEGLFIVGPLTVSNATIQECEDKWAEFREKWRALLGPSFGTMHEVVFDFACEMEKQFYFEFVTGCNEFVNKQKWTAEKLISRAKTLRVKMAMVSKSAEYCRRSLPESQDETKEGFDSDSDKDE
jgi:hypothetical protein